MIFFQLWDVRTENILHEFKGHHETVGACAFIPHSMFSSHNLIVTASSDCSVKVWDQDTQGMNCVFHCNAILTFLTGIHMVTPASFTAYFTLLQHLDVFNVEEEDTASFIVVLYLNVLLSSVCIFIALMHYG